MSTAAASVALVAAVAGKDDHDEEEKALIHRSQTEKMTPLGVCLHRRSQQEAPRLAPAGTLPGAPIGSPPPPAALSGAADR